jgi:hypothetical protein
MGEKNITFTKMIDVVSDEYTPRPASKNIPEWFKKTKPYLNENNTQGVNVNLQPEESIKKCVPVLDALSSGYIIPTYTDLWIKKDENGNIIYATAGDINIEFHPIIQAPYHPKMNHHPYPKWNNPWSIKTPKGYSCLFIPPVHGGNKYFTILEGVVDTDIYTAPVLFPFVLNDTNFEGLIPAGTPMVQVIPIKRDNWKMQMGDYIDREKNDEIHKKLKSLFFDR